MLGKLRKINKVKLSKLELVDTTGGDEFETFRQNCLDLESYGAGLKNAVKDFLEEAKGCTLAHAEFFEGISNYANAEAPSLPDEGKHIELNDLLKRVREIWASGLEETLVTHMDKNTMGKVREIDQLALNFFKHLLPEKEQLRKDLEKAKSMQKKLIESRDVPGLKKQKAILVALNSEWTEINATMKDTEKFIWAGRFKTFGRIFSAYIQSMKTFFQAITDALSGIEKDLQRVAEQQAAGSQAGASASAPSQLIRAPSVETFSPVVRSRRQTKLMHKVKRTLGVGHSRVDATVDAAFEALVSDLIKYNSFLTEIPQWMDMIEKANSGLLRVAETLTENIGSNVAAAPSPRDAQLQQFMLDAGYAWGFWKTLNQEMVQRMEALRGSIKNELKTVESLQTLVIERSKAAQNMDYYRGKKKSQAHSETSVDDFRSTSRKLKEAVEAYQRLHQQCQQAIEQTLRRRKEMLADLVAQYLKAQLDYFAGVLRAYDKVQYNDGADTLPSGNSNRRTRSAIPPALEKKKDSPGDPKVVDSANALEEKEKIVERLVFSAVLQPPFGLVFRPGRGLRRVKKVAPGQGADLWNVMATKPELKIYPGDILQSIFDPADNSPLVVDCSDFDLEDLDRLLNDVGEGESLSFFFCRPRTAKSQSQEQQENEAGLPLRQHSSDCLTDQLPGFFSSPSFTSSFGNFASPSVEGLPVKSPSYVSPPPQVKNEATKENFSAAQDNMITPPSRPERAIALTPREDCRPSGKKPTPPPRRTPAPPKSKRRPPPRSRSISRTPRSKNEPKNENIAPSLNNNAISPCPPASGEATQIHCVSPAKAQSVVSPPKAKSAVSPPKANPEIKPKNSEPKQLRRSGTLNIIQRSPRRARKPLPPIPSKAVTPTVQPAGQDTNPDTAAEPTQVEQAGQDTQSPAELQKKQNKVHADSPFGRPRSKSSPQIMHQINWVIPRVPLSNSKEPFLRRGSAAPPTSSAEPEPDSRSGSPVALLIHPSPSVGDLNPSSTPHLRLKTTPRTESFSSGLRIRFSSSSPRTSHTKSTFTSAATEQDNSVIKSSLRARYKAPLNPDTPRPSHGTPHPSQGTPHPNHGTTDSDTPHPSHSCVRKGSWPTIPDKKEITPENIESLFASTTPLMNHSKAHMSAQNLTPDTKSDQPAAGHGLTNSIPVADQTTSTPAPEKSNVPSLLTAFEPFSNLPKSPLRNCYSAPRKNVPGSPETAVCTPFHSPQSPCVKTSPHSSGTPEAPSSPLTAEQFLPLPASRYESPASAQSKAHKHSETVPAMLPGTMRSPSKPDSTPSHLSSPPNSVTSGQSSTQRGKTKTARKRSSPSRTGKKSSPSRLDSTPLQKGESPYSRNRNSLYHSPLSPEGCTPQSATSTSFTPPSATSRSFTKCSSFSPKLAHTAGSARSSSLHSSSLHCLEPHDSLSSSKKHGKHKSVLSGSGKDFATILGTALALGMATPSPDWNGRKSSDDSPATPACYNTPPSKPEFESETVNLFENLGNTPALNHLTKTRPRVASRRKEPQSLTKKFEPGRRVSPSANCKISPVPSREIHLTPT